MEKNEFHKFVMNNIAQTGLSAEDRDNLYSDSPYTTITESIKNLRLVDKDNGKGSEIAEIILWGITYNLIISYIAERQEDDTVRAWNAK